MTEPKPKYVTDYAYSGNLTEPKPRYTVSPEKPTKLPPGSAPNPPIGETGSIYDDDTCRMSSDAPDYLIKYNPLIINNDTLSAQQLHELIVSQSMTIDVALTRNGELVDALKRIRDLLINGKFYEAWIAINKVLE